MIAARSLMSRHKVRTSKAVRAIKPAIVATIAVSFFSTVAATVQMAVAPAAATAVAQGQASGPDDINWG
jgi:hypothetical protein